MTNTEKTALMLDTLKFVKRPIDPSGVELNRLMKALAKADVTLGEFLYWVHQQGPNCTQDIDWSKKSEFKFNNF